MKRRDILRGAAAGAGLSVLGGNASGKQRTSRRIVGVGNRAKIKDVKNAASKVHRTLNLGGRYAVVGDFVDARASTMASAKGVRYVENDYKAKALEQTLPWGIDRVDAEIAHSNGFTGEGADIAILDSGIDSDHPDLQANLGDGHAEVNCGETSGGSSCSTTNDCEEPWDDHYGHGTHCAGIVGAIDNTEDVIGVSPSITLHSVTVLGCNGYGYYSDIAAGLEYAADQGWDVASMSLGGTTGSRLLKDALQYAESKGMLTVAAAGNNGSCTDCVIYPAKYEEALAVSATDSDDSLASFSSQGPEVDLAAPGSAILSTIPPEYDSSGTEWKSGTSMACPHVSGAAGMLMANGYTAAEARQRLEDSAEDIGLSENEQGAGLLDVESAISENEPSNMIGEAHTTTIDSSWTTIRTDQSYNNPVVITGSPTFNDSGSAHVRVRNVKSGSFEMKIEEWSGDTHRTEEVGYLVLEEGEHRVKVDGTTAMDIDVGTVNADGTAWEEIPYSADLGAEKFIFSNIQTANDTTPAVVRNSGVSPDNAELLIQEAEAEWTEKPFSDHSTETVGYLASQVYNKEQNASYEVSANVIADDDFNSGQFVADHDSKPVTIHEMQSMYGMNTAQVRKRNETEDNFEVKVQEETTHDDDLIHVNEFIGTLAFPAGSIESA